MSQHIVFVLGSPSLTSRSSSVARAVAAHVDRAGLATRVFSLRDFDAADVLLARSDATAVQTFLQAVKSAAAIVLSSPVYKGTYGGSLKALVDMIPPDALIGKPVLGIATTRLEAHGPEVDRAFLALAAFFRARPLDTLVVLDEAFPAFAGEGEKAATFIPAVEERIARTAGALLAAIGKPLSVSAAG
jgi:FMN reductase